MALGAAHAAELVDVQNPHARGAAGTGLRRRRPSARREADAHVLAPLAAECLAQRRVARERREPRREPVDVADRDEVAALAFGDHRAGAARTRRDDRPLGRERLDRDHRRALVLGRQQQRVERGVPAADALLEADEVAAVGDAQLARERLRRAPLVAVPDEHELRVDALVDEHAQRSYEVERPLDRGQPAGPADDEVSLPAPRSARMRSRASSSASLHGGSSNP